MSRTIQLSFSGLTARVLPDGFSDSGYILEIGGAEQSHVDLAHPDTIFYEYLRRIGNVLDTGFTPGESITAAHLGAGALTLARYLQATRPGSAQIAVDIERELPSFVVQQLSLPAGTNCQLLIGDAREAIPELPARLGVEKIDAIIVDIFTGWSAPEHLTQPGFYREIQNILQDSGVLCVNIGDDAGLSFFIHQAQTMLEIFEHVWCLTDSSMLSGKHAGNLILVGASQPLSEENRTALLAAGPHPAAVLSTAEVQELVKTLKHQ